MKTFERRNPARHVTERVDGAASQQNRTLLVVSSVCTSAESAVEITRSVVYTIAGTPSKVSPQSVPDNHELG